MMIAHSIRQRLLAYSTAVASTILVHVGTATAVPWGGDDTGFLTTDATQLRCEQKAARKAAKLAKAIVKCHIKAADSAFKGAAFDEEACETVAIQKFQDLDVTKCPCVDKDNIVNNWEADLDSYNDQIYCNTSGTPFGGDDGGYVPLTKEELKCQDAIAKCVPKLVKDYTKCHHNTAKAFLKSVPFDEEACEEGPIPEKPGKAALERWNTCVGKVIAKGGCNGCEAAGLNTLAGLIDAEIGDGNELLYCGGTCPTSMTITANGSDADVDLGWTGQGHDNDAPSSTALTLAVSNCANASEPCGQCDTTGPIVNPGAAANRRCRGDNSGANGSWMKCTSGADCPGTDNACVYFAGPPRPTFGGGGLSLCTISEFVGAATGTVDVTGGSSTTFVGLSWRNYVGGDFAHPTAHPCPRCIANLCSGGQRDGSPCTVMGTSAVFLGDPLSFDCPPSAGVDIGDAQTVTTIQLATGTQSRTLSSASPSCTAPGHTSEKCFCATCNGLPATPCSSDGDCIAVGATTCGAGPGITTQPNKCDDGVCTPNTPPDNDSTNEGVCAAGPLEYFCAIETFRSCAVDTDCPASGDTCSLGKYRQCFTTTGVIGDVVSVSGVASVSTPTLGALFCAPPSTSAAVSAAFGYPGLVRMTLPATATFH